MTALLVAPSYNLVRTTYDSNDSYECTEVMYPIFVACRVLNIGLAAFIAVESSLKRCPDLFTENVPQKPC